MAISGADRALRTITILTWPFSFALLLAYGISYRSPVPSLLIIPMTLSALTGMIHLSNGAKSRAGNLFMEIVNVVFFVAFIPPAIATLPRAHYWSRGSATMLGTFGICPTMFNFCIHAYYILSETPICRLLHRLFGSVSPIFFWIGTIFTSETCPHCQRDLRLLWDMPSDGSEHSQKSYVQVSTEEHVENEDEQMIGPSRSMDEARPSTDDETARLV